MATVHHVRPAGWQNGPDQEIWNLADLDYMMPTVFLQYTLVYEITDQTKQTETNKKLQEALALTLSQCRTLSGTFQKVDGEIKICKSREATVPFIIRQLGQDDEAPSLAELKAVGYPPSDIAKIAGVGDGFPTDIDSMSKNRCSISEFRATWIPGGLLLTVGYHHSAMDNTGFSACIHQWAKNFSALSSDATQPTWDPANMNRKRLNSKFVSPERRINPPKGPKLDFPVAATGPMRSIILHFARESVTKLKEAASSAQAAASSYDAITAMLWRVLTRARLTTYDPVPGEFTMLGSAVNVRGRFSPALSADLQANACTGTLAGPIPVLDAVADGGLPHLASLVGQSSAAVTERVCMERAYMVAMLKDKTLSALSVDDMPRFSMGMSDTRYNGLYDVDFGFGLPVALRNTYRRGRPCDLRHLHSQAGSDSAESPLPGVEVEMPVELPCLEQITQDPELLEYAVVIAK